MGALLGRVSTFNYLNDNLIGILADCTDLLPSFLARAHYLVPLPEGPSKEGLAGDENASRNRGLVQARYSEQKKPFVFTSENPLADDWPLSLQFPATHLLLPSSVFRRPSLLVWK